MKELIIRDIEYVTSVGEGNIRFVVDEHITYIYFVDHGILSNKAMIPTRILSKIGTLINEELEPLIKRTYE